MVIAEVVQIALSKPSRRLRQRMDLVRAMFDSYKLITEWEPEHKEFYNSIPTGTVWHWLRSDVIRFEYLSTHENVLYLDWDVEVKEIPKVTGLTWAPLFDYWAIFNSDKTAVFKKILEKGIEDISRRPSWRRTSRAWLLQYIARAGGETFSEKSLIHNGVCFV